jgi:hypothetical protein
MPDTSISYNLNLFTVGPVSLPFNQYDWTPPRSVRLTPQVDVQFNPNIQTNPVPFNQFDWTPSRGLHPVLATDQPYNQNLYTVTTAPLPFNQYDWTPSRQSPPAPTDFYNLVIFQLSYPFNLTDWSVPVQPRFVAAPDQPYNQALYSIPTAPLPFNTYDYPQAVRVPHAPYDLSLSLNPNLFLNPIPSLNFDWTPPRHFPPALLDQSIGFQILNIPVVTPTLIQRTLTGVGL